MVNKNYYDVIIIGGGPGGLIALDQLQNKCRVILLEGQAVLGGQVANLYQNKMIHDLRHFSPIKGQAYINKLISSIDSSLIKLNQRVEQINIEADALIEISTNTAKYYGRFVILATGLGFYSPLKLNLEYDDLDNIFYSVSDIEDFKDQVVAVFGGGDSAIDWVLHLSKIAQKVFIIHRRTEFRGDITPLNDLDNVKIITPFVPIQLIPKNNLITNVKIQNVQTEQVVNLDVDRIIVSYGSIPTSTSFNLLFEKGNFIVNHEFETSLNRVYALGDAITYHNKIKRIEPIYQEASKIVKTILHKL